MHEIAKLDMLEDPVRVQDTQMMFNVRECEKFTDKVSHSTFPFIFKKVQCVKCLCGLKEEHP